MGEIRNTRKIFIEKVMLDRSGDVDLRKIFIPTFQIVWWGNCGIDSASTEQG